MREVIRQALTDGVPEVNGRVFEPFAAGAEIEKPYLVVKEVADDDNTEWAGLRARVEVWAYVEQGSLKATDQLTKEAISALNMQPLPDESGDVLTCIHDSTGEDIIDEEWDALTRCAYFYALAIQPAGTPGSLENDPWINALVTWTRGLLGDAIEVYGGRLPTGYKRPAVLWRLDNLTVDDAGAFAFNVSKQVAGHVFGRNAVEEANIAVSISEEMGNAVKIPLKPSQRLYMTLKTLNTTLYTDALKQGHIRALLTRKTKHPKEDVPTIGHVDTNGILRENSYNV